MFQSFALKLDYISRKFGMSLSGRNYITCRSILAAAVAELKSVSVGQVMSKDVPCSDDKNNVFCMSSINRI